MLTRISGRPAAYEASHGHSINDYSDRLLLAALLVLAGLEVVLVARANDGGVTARLVEEPLAEGLLAALIERRVGETRVSVSVRGSETVKTFVV